MSLPVCIKKATPNDIGDILKVLSPSNKNDEDCCKEIAQDILENSIAFINYLGDEPICVSEFVPITEKNIKIAATTIYIKEGFNEHRSEFLLNIEWQALTRNFNQMSIIAYSKKTEKFLEDNGYKETKSSINHLTRRLDNIKEYTKNLFIQ